MANNCNPGNALPTVVTSGLIALYITVACLVIISGTIAAYKKSKRKILEQQAANMHNNNDKPIEMSIKDCIRHIPGETWRKRACYLPFATHIIDQAADIGVIIEFYQINKFESKSKENDCQNINVNTLFHASCLAFLFYRFVSAFWVFTFTNYSICNLILQILDVKIYHALYINFLLNRKYPTSIKRYIQILEASPESFPQVTIQLFYFINIGFDPEKNWFIWTSLLVSVYNISAKMISEELYFEAEWHDFLVKGVIILIINF